MIYDMVYIYIWYIYIYGIYGIWYIIHVWYIYIYGVPWIPSIYPMFVRFLLAYIIYQHHGSVMGYIYIYNYIYISYRLVYYINTASVY